MKVDENWSFQQKMFSRIYPDSKPIDLSQILVPKQLRAGVQKFNSVKRYDNLEHTPDRCIDDDVMRHLYRGAGRIITAPGDIPSRFPKWATRWFSHDWGEWGKLRDILVTEKASNISLALSTELEEQDVARKHLPKGFFAYYEEVELASKFLREKTEEVPTALGITMRVVDKCDGPLVYFYNYCHWLQTHAYDGKIPPDVVFNYTLSENNKFRGNLLKTVGKIDKRTLDVCLYLLYQEIKIVISLWNEVDPKKWPPVMSKQLQQMEKYLEDNLNSSGF